jgi:hypothetical protein
VSRAVSSRQCIWALGVDDEAPPGTRGNRGSGTEELGADVVEDMVDDHAFGQTCGKRRDLSMDVC